MSRQSFYLGAKAIIEDNGKVLILKDTARDKWELPGGRVDAGQNLEDAMARELSEEIKGTKLKEVNQLVHFAIGDFTVENNHRLCLVFYSAKVNFEGSRELSDEHSELAWATLKTLNNYDLFSTDKKAIEIYFRTKNRSDS